MKNVWFYDIECMKFIHTFYAINRDTKEEVHFVIHKDKNDIIEYKKFILSCIKSGDIFIGFNNINYDYPVLHQIITRIFHNTKFDKLNDPDWIVNFIYNTSISTIRKENSAIYPSNVLIYQIDLFKIHHYDNPNKRTSLKYIEGVLRMDEIEEFDNFDRFIGKDDIKDVLFYNRHDVIATQLFYYETLPDIKMRKDLSGEYGLDLYNCSDPKIGSEIFALFISKKKGITVQELKTQRTIRESVNLSDCVLPYIKFKSNEFNKLLSKVKSKVITANKTKDTFEIKSIIRGIEFVIGAGGIHAFKQSGRYKIEDGWEIVDIDVSSFYSGVAITNRFSPEHLGQDFCDIYEDRYNYRLSIKKDKSKSAIAGGWKLALNGVSGLGQNQYSYFYDLKFPLDIRINGQLLICLLIEDILIAFPDLIFIQANTDGFTIKIRSEFKERLFEICKEWEKLTKLNLEFSYYKEVCIRDVNNYLCIYNKEEKDLVPSFPIANWYDNNYCKHKTKGAYQVIPEANGKISYNKNWDSIIVRKAVHDYFIYNRPVKDTILNSRDILDFCSIFKCASDFTPLFISNSGETTKLSKVTRYYVSSGGKGSIKKVRKVKLKSHERGSNESNVEAGYSVTLFNKKVVLDNFNDYNIDYSYYLREANKLVSDIEQVTQTKLTLF